MKVDRTMIGVIFVCCFLGASIIALVLKGNQDPTLNNEQMNPAIEQAIQDNTTDRNERDSVIQRNTTGFEYDDISDLEALLGDMIDGDIGDAMDMIWSSRSITADFSDRNKVAEQVNQFPIVGDVKVPEEQLNQLRNCVTEMIFSNGNNDHDSYLRFLRESGEIVERHRHRSEPGDEAWKMLARSLKNNKEKYGHRSMWEGLVLEASRIAMFETQSSKVPLGEDLFDLRGAIRTFADLTDPPISLEDMLKAERKVLMAEVQVFIAHDSSLGGVVWPYRIQYWFDPVNDCWRVHQAAMFPNRHKAVLNIIVL